MIRRIRYATSNKFRLLVVLFALGIYVISTSFRVNSIKEREDAGCEIVETLWHTRTSQLHDSLRIDSLFGSYLTMYEAMVKLRGDSAILPCDKNCDYFFIIEEFVANVARYKRTIFCYKNDSVSSHSYTYQTNQPDSVDFCCINHLGSVESFTLTQNRDYRSIIRSFDHGRSVDYQKYSEPLYVGYNYKSKKPSRTKQEQRRRKVEQQLLQTSYLYTSIDVRNNSVFTYFRVPPAACNVKVYPSRTRS